MEKLTSSQGFGKEVGNQEVSSLCPFLRLTRDSAAQSSRKEASTLLQLGLDSLPMWVVLFSVGLQLSVQRRVLFSSVVVFHGFNDVRTANSRLLIR